MSFETLILLRVMELRPRHKYDGADKLLIMLADPEHGLPVIVGRDRLLSILRQNGMLSQLYKRHKNTSFSRHKLPIYPNIIKDLKVNTVNQVWVSDITYIRLAKGRFCYLFLVSDLFSRKILGYALKMSLASEGAEEALQMALDFAKPEAGFIHHSDHGIQYCSKSYVTMLKNYGAIISMTGDKHCYENAVAERINGILKYEYGLGSTLPNLKAAQLLTDDGIKIYNSERLHTSLGFRTPDRTYETSVRSLRNTA